jgi:cytosine/adenosine deaminase-related metal-dependent hydrolase
MPRTRRVCAADPNEMTDHASHTDAPVTEASLVIAGCDAITHAGAMPRRADIGIAGGRIAFLDSPGRRPVPDGARVVEGRGLLALPGLVNAHTHSAENCLRGAGEGLALEVWLTRMFGTAGAFTPEDHYATALGGALEMLRSGTTAVLDHLWMTPPTVEAASAVLRAYRDAGIRAAVAPLVADIDSTGEFAYSCGHDLSGALFTDLAGAQAVSEIEAQLEQLMGDWHGAADGRIKVFAGPVGLQWCSDELLQALAASAARHDTGLTIHALETHMQAEVARHRFGVGAVQALDRLGVLGPRTSLAHCVWLDPGDPELIAGRESVVVHNPSANFRLGSGIAPIPELVAAGAHVALGCDGSASSDNQVLWSQLKLAALIHNDDVRGRWVSSQQALAMATTGGARALGEAGRLGTLAEGALADLVLLDASSDGMAGALDVGAALALSETGRGVVHVIVDGRVVVEDGICVTVDEAAVHDALRRQSAARRGELPPAIAEAMDRVARLKQHVHKRAGAPA